MKRKAAKIFDFKEWVEEFIHPIEEVWIEEKKGVSRFQMSGSSPALENQRNKVIEFMKTNAAVFLEFQELTLEYARILEYEFPTIYPVVVKAAGELNDRFYVNARMFWPMPGGKRKELRFYICPYTEGMDIKSDKFMSLTRQKIARELRTRGEEGFFSKINAGAVQNVDDLFIVSAKPKSKKKGK